jgi:hypothetical protein
VRKELKSRTCRGWCRSFINFGSLEVIRSWTANYVLDDNNSLPRPEIAKKVYAKVELSDQPRNWDVFAVYMLVALVSTNESTDNERIGP